MEKDIKLLMAIFEEDIKKYGRASHISDLTLLTIKSLMPSEDSTKVKLDYKRYREEFKLWKFYKHGDNKALLNVMNGKNEINSKLYWLAEDNSAYPRVIPIILANKDYSIIKNQVLENILFTTGNIETLIEGLLISKLIYLLTVDEGNIIEKLKAEVIELSQIDFIERFKESFRMPLETYQGNFSADFERNKINALTLLNSLKSNKFHILLDCLFVLLEKKSAETSIGKVIEVYLRDDFIGDFESKDYFEELGVYIQRLREGEVPRKNLRIDKYYLPDIFQIEEGKIFYHSLLNKSKIIKREMKNNKKISYVSTKSGIYKFIK